VSVLGITISRETFRNTPTSLLSDGTPEATPDGERMEKFASLIEGKRLTYREVV